MLFIKTIQYTIFLYIKLSFLSIGQKKSKLQKQISKLLILTWAVSPTKKPKIIINK